MLYGLTPYEQKHYDLFNAFHDFEKDFFNDSFSGAFRTDIKDNGGSYTVEAELPGFNKEDIKIDINGDALMISAEHSEKKDEKDSDGKYIRRERSYGSVSRTFDVSGIQTENIAASYNNGILTLELPKKQAVKPETRRLEIK